ncbi:MAG: hypothetical protein LBL19_03955 [Spirochaetaceae bacterium]|jgi:hypothetical protein|nr:hypothetical protein [Spirochaetaceae bacterium]
MRARNWILRPDAKFNAFFANYCRGVTRYTSGLNPAWTHVPADRVTELNIAYGDWYAVFIKLDDPHTSADVLAKNETRQGSERVLRDFNRQYVLYAREVSDAQRVELGCPVHKRSHSPMSRPKIPPEADIIYRGQHLLELVNIRPVAAMEEEDCPAFGVRIYWGILGAPTAADTLRLPAPPLRGSDLPHSVFTRRKRCRFDFDGESGKTVYFCLRYETAKGGIDGGGPFGPIFSAIIP